MSFDVRITDRAEDDLRSIYHYIAFHLRSAENAASVLDRLEQNIYSLEQMPERYRLYEEEPWQSRGVRRFPVGNCCVFYLPDPVSGTVDVLRVLFAGSDMDRIMADTAFE